MTGDGVNDAPNVGILVEGATGHRVPGGCVAKFRWTVWYKHYAQFSATLWSPRNVSDAHRAGANRLTNETNIGKLTEQPSTTTTGRVQEEEVRRYFAMVT